MEPIQVKPMDLIDEDSTPITGPTLHPRLPPELLTLIAIHLIQPYALALSLTPSNTRTICIIDPTTIRPWPPSDPPSSPSSQNATPFTRPLLRKSLLTISKSFLTHLTRALHHRFTSIITINLPYIHDTKPLALRPSLLYNPTLVTTIQINGVSGLHLPLLDLPIYENLRTITVTLPRSRSLYFLPRSDVTDGAYDAWMVRGIPLCETGWERMRCITDLLHPKVALDVKVTMRSQFEFNSAPPVGGGHLNVEIGFSGEGRPMVVNRCPVYSRRGSYSAA